MRMERTHVIVGLTVIIVMAGVAVFPENTGDDATLPPLPSLPELRAQTLRHPDVPVDTVGTFFKDVNPRKLGGRAASYLGFRAIVQGFPGEMFKGDLSVNRAEVAKMLLLAANIPVDTELGVSRFGDVRGNEWFASYIATAAELGIVEGYSDGTFRPGRGANAAEFLKMATKTFELPENIPHQFTDFHPSEWFRAYAGVAWEYHLFPPQRSKNILEPHRFLTRYEVAIALMQILTWGTDGHYFEESWKRLPWGQAPLDLPDPYIQPPPSSSSETSLSSAQ